MHALGPGLSHAADTIALWGPAVHAGGVFFEVALYRMLEVIPQLYHAVTGLAL